MGAGLSRPLKIHVFSTRDTQLDQFVFFLAYKDKYHLLYRTTTKENHNVGPKIQIGLKIQIFTNIKQKKKRLISTFLKHFAVAGMFVSDISSPFSP